MALRAYAILLALTLVACQSTDGGGSTGTNIVQTDAATLPSETIPQADAATDAPNVWANVEAKTAEVVNAHSIQGLGLAVYDAQDKKVFEKVFGDFAPDRRVPIASASKLVSGLVLFHLINQRKLSLDSTTGDVLKWIGPKSRITLKHLMSFTSGLAASNSCTANPLVTLEACVQTISQTTLEALPGQQFEYGPVHLAVAGRMAEVVTGKSWNALFTEVLATPLGLPADVGYTTLPRSGTGTNNPLVAAGLRVSMNEYAPLLATAFHKGTFKGATIASSSLFDTQATEPFPNATIAYSPIKDMGLPFHYGLTSWLECSPPASACPILSSPGAWGFTPWLDREAGYYAVIGTFINSTGENGIVDYTVQLAQDLKPEIRKALTH